MNLKLPFTGGRARQLPSSTVVLPESISPGIRPAAMALDRYAAVAAGVDHNAWDPAYNDADMASWLLDQRRR